MAKRKLTILILLIAGPLAAAGCGGGTVAPSAESAAADHYLAGQIYLAQGELELALEELSQAVSIKADMALAYSRIGGIYKTRGQMEESARAYEKAIQLDPRSFHDLVELGGVYQAMQRLADALALYARAIEVKPDDYQAHFELGTLHYRLGHLGEAEAGFKRCVEIDDRRPEAFAHLGVVFDAQGRYYDASRAYRDSLERKLEQPKVMVNLATTYIKQDRHRSAVDVLKFARGLDPDDAMIHEKLGFCYYRLGKWPEARDCYVRSMELDRHNPDTLAGLGTVLMILSIKSRANDLAQAESLRTEALEYWHRSLELNPDQPRLTALLEKYGPQQQAGDMLRP